MKHIVFAAAVSGAALLSIATATLAADMTVTMADLMSVDDDNPGSPITIQGVSRDAFLVQLEDSDVTVPDAVVIDFGTNGSTFVVVVGLLAKPMLACVQTSKESRLAAIGTVTQRGDYKIKGKFDHYQAGTTQTSVGNYGTVILADCAFQRLQ